MDAQVEVKQRELPSGINSQRNVITKQRLALLGGGASMQSTCPRINDGTDKINDNIRRVCQSCLKGEGSVRSSLTPNGGHSLTLSKESMGSSWSCAVTQRIGIQRPNSHADLAVYLSHSFCLGEPAFPQKTGISHPCCCFVYEVPG